MNDLELVYQNAPSENDVTEDPETDIVNFGDIASQTVYGWINTQATPIVIQPQNEGYTLFKGTIAGELKSFLWIGEAGTYGAGEIQATEGDFQLIADAPPVPYTPSLDEVTAAGNIMLNKQHNFKKFIDGAEAQEHVIDDQGQHFTKGGLTVYEGYADPVANVMYTKPAKEVDDTYAMMSDLKQQPLKIIDADVVGSLYTIVNEDFGKTLVYKGLDDINMLLSTNLTYQAGYTLNVIQSGMGHITFVADGFILDHSPDELPVTYSYHSTACLIILEEYSALVFGKLKLAD